MKKIDIHDIITMKSAHDYKIGGLLGYVQFESFFSSFVLFEEFSFSFNLSILATIYAFNKITLTFYVHFSI